MTVDEYQDFVAQLTGQYVGPSGALSSPECRYVYYRAVIHTLSRALPVRTFRSLCDLLNDTEFEVSLEKLIQTGLLHKKIRSQDQEVLVCALSQKAAATHTAR